MFFECRRHQHRNENHLCPVWRCAVRNDLQVCWQIGTVSRIPNIQDHWCRLKCVWTNLNFIVCHHVKTDDAQQRQKSMREPKASVSNRPRYLVAQIMICLNTRSLEHRRAGNQRLPTRDCLSHFAGCWRWWRRYRRSHQPVKQLVITDDIMSASSSPPDRKQLVQYN